MSRSKDLIVFTAVIATGLALGVHAADKSAATAAPQLPKKIKMNEPMSTGMMKKGMMKGDVRSAAEKKQKALQPMIEQEQESMPQHKAKP